MSAALLAILRKILLVAFWGLLLVSFLFNRGRSRGDDSRGYDTESGFCYWDCSDNGDCGDSGSSDDSGW